MLLYFFYFYIQVNTKKKQPNNICIWFLYVCLFKAPTTTELNDLSFLVTACDQRTYGENCSEICSPNCAGLDQACDNVNGSCISGCDVGYQGEKCDAGKDEIVLTELRFFLDLIIAKISA